MYNRSMTVKYCCIQAFYWMSYAVIMGFVNLYLLDAGYTSTSIGTIIAGGGILSAVLQPLIAAQADRSKVFTLKRLFLLLSFDLLACSLVLLVCRGRTLLTGLFYTLLITLLQSSIALVNALGVTGEELPNFGLGRGFGSISYAAIAFGLGYLADFFGVVTIPIAMLAAYIALTLVVLSYPNVKSSGVIQQKADSDTPIAFFKRYPRYGLVLVGCVLLFISHVLLNSFTFQIVSTKGGGSAEMGTSMALAAIIEIPTMVFFAQLLKLAKCSFWFRICGIFFFLKSLFTLLVPSIPGFYAVQLFQMGGWGIISVSAVYYASSIMAPRDAVKGQAYYTVSFTLGNVLGAVLGGWLIDLAGVTTMLIFGTVCALIGAVILLLFTQNPDAK